MTFIRPNKTTVGI